MSCVAFVASPRHESVVAKELAGGCDRLGSGEGMFLWPCGKGASRIRQNPIRITKN